MLAPKVHSNLLHINDALIVVIDMQAPFLQTMYESARLEKNVSTLMSGANILRVPIIATVQNEKTLGGVIESLRSHLPNMRPAFNKMTFSCYSDSAFASELNRSGRRQIILCGLESHICIEQTAYGLLAAGFQVHVVVDAVSSRTEQNWRIGLEKMRAGGVLVSSVEMALFEMMQQAGTPDFREMLKVIK